MKHAHLLELITIFGFNSLKFKKAEIMLGKTKVGPSYMKTDIIYTKKLNI